MKYPILNFFFFLFLFLSFRLVSNNDDRKLALHEFNVVQNGTKTDIKWIMNREPLGTYFTIEKSTDGKDFVKVIDLPVAENGNIFEEYFETDYQPYKGVSFYRLKQTDDAGNTYYSDMVSVKYSEEQSQRLYSAIPQNDPNLVANVKNAEGREGLFILRDADGNDHYSKINLQEEDNHLYAAWAFPQVPPGIYRIVGSSNNQLYSLKLIIK